MSVADASTPAPGNQHRLCVPRTSSLSLSSRFPEADLNIAVPTKASMIARCGPRTGLLDPHSPAGLAGAARPLRHCQRRRDPDAAARGRCAAPHQSSPEDVMARPRCAQRPEQAAARTAAPGAAGVATHTAPVARPAPGEDAHDAVPIPGNSDPDSVAGRGMRNHTTHSGACGAPVARKRARRVREAARGNPPVETPAGRPESTSRGPVELALLRRRTAPTRTRTGGSHPPAAR